MSMTAPIFHPIRLFFLTGALAACASANGPVPTAPDETAGRRAALAGLTVVNRTGRPLVIAFRPAAAPASEVVVGRIAGTTTERMAPIPAGEPIVLVARDAQGAELTLPARSFEVGAGWRWVISADERFGAPQAPEP